ncbi:MAG: 30S ribosomal protein S16 [Chloroflexi bacterium]|nr:30S ribosomal protein S16 [Chloroflexota bacterium]
MQRRGAKKRPSYRVVVIPARSARDSRCVDDLGYYDPVPDPSTVAIDVDRAADWIRKGAQPSDRVAKLLESIQPNFSDFVRSGVTLEAAQQAQAAALQIARQRRAEAEAGAAAESPEANGEEEPVAAD